MPLLRKSLRSSTSRSRIMEELPHKGSLCRIEDSVHISSYILRISIAPDSSNNSTNDDDDVDLLGIHDCYCASTHELMFDRKSFSFTSRLFAILDTESQGVIEKDVVRDFVLQRCPVFAKRDEDLARLKDAGRIAANSPTFEELWKAVLECSVKPVDVTGHLIGLEGWMVFSRFIALAQYLEAKRRFVARHKQQMMRTTEVVMVDFPPPESPSALTAARLAEYEQSHQRPLNLPELDLDHSLLAAHDRAKTRCHAGGLVKISLFGSKPDDFILTCSKGMDEISVRRSLADLQWLDETFRAQKVLGGTLCGRILPPFPIHKHQDADESSSKAAAAAVGRLKHAAKTYWSGKKQRKSSMKGSHNHRWDISRRLERYIGYLLEHPSLCTSFPLNVILTASQSGIDAARQAVSECSKTVQSAELQTTSDAGEAVVSSSLPNLGLGWIRTAAQTAVALKVHGFLETTGLQSASAKLQHAALPSYGKQRWKNDSSDEEGSAEGGPEGTAVANNFEEGVVHDDGFDLLPLPVPAPERRILTVGSTQQNVESAKRFTYGNGDLDGSEHLTSDGGTAFLADIAVDENIDKLREVIGSVDNTLNRCLTSLGKIEEATYKRNTLHHDIVKGLDSWPEMRGKFISQRCLMKGVSGIEQSTDVCEESTLNFCEELSWQASLAEAAVSAAEDVRATVRAARTAANARAAASAASLSAEIACEKNKFSHFDEMRSLQTRASIAQSHAIHAAVVEYEASMVKRRSTMALAHDVKTWNMHRKREVLQSCITFARSQHEASRRAVDAWASLMNGFLGSTINPSAVERRPPPSTLPLSIRESTTVLDVKPSVEPGEVTTAIYSGMEDRSQQRIVAVDHSALFLGSTAGGESSTLSDADQVSLPFAQADLVASANDSVMSDCPFQSMEAQLSGNMSGRSMMSQQEVSAHPVVQSEILSSSMQSLVDGLMNWGGGFETEEDFGLTGKMAASFSSKDGESTGG